MANVDAIVLKPLVELVREPNRCRIDDPDSFGFRYDLLQASALGIAVYGAKHLEEQVLALDSRVYGFRFTQPKLLDDVFAHLRRCGCGKRQNGWVAKRFDGISERQVRRTEIVSPLRDAVRFVHHEE